MLFTKKLTSETKLAITAAVIGLTLTGCGSSSQAEQLAWIDSWNSNYTEKMQMVNVCFKEAGVSRNTTQLSNKQNKIINQCELSYISEVAENVGISLDRELLENNILQF